MNKRGLLTTNPILVLIAFIVVSVFLLSIFDTGDITGYAIKKAKCVDSDGGRITGVYGTVTVGKTVKKDTCTRSNNRPAVMEQYCTATGNYASKTLTCTNGCKNGACY